ncbi:MAG TPA: CDP-alcohol phosphatidyltransferase family protein [Syntrophorhabdaceae bacterium]
MNIPNILSIFRLFLTIFFVMAVNQGRLRLALLLFVIQGVSDLLDGLLARILNLKTPLGAFLDPIADKAMLVSAYVVLFLNGIMPMWITLVVLIKDVVTATGFLILYRMFGKVRLIPSIYGKSSTMLQILTVVYVLWSEEMTYGDYLFYLTAAVTIVAGALYVARGIAILTKREPAS